VVVDHDGIVGKHAGDGVSAFFLVDDLGSASAAARAAVGAARGISAAARRVAADNDLEDDDVRLNVGAHWGGTLYMGQVTTGGRLEVTALGDEVNECARIQQAAREGMVVASKALVERLAPSDAGAVGLDPDLATYRALAELPGADEKVVRDAGLLPVTLVEAPV
jgi:class 3 adenylate cyclase